MKRITLFVLCLLLSGKMHASHVASAEIRYEYTGTGNDYAITLTVVKACELYGASLDNQESISFSSSTTATFIVTIPMVSRDTIENFCSGYPGSCSNPGSPNPGYEKRIYSDTVSLLPAPDWKISWTLCCRNIGITNLQNPGGEGLYVESFLDNSASVNTSSYMANPFPFFISASSLSTIPVQTVDAENDSLAFDWYQPLDSTPAPIAYAPGYSLASPMGGTTLIDPVNQTLLLDAPLTGKYVLALKVSEYRAGQLIGYTMRDFMVSVLGTTPAALTVPMPAPGSIMHYVTCPGQTNSISLNLTDSTATDSVYADIITPALPGWSFTTAVTPGLGGANVSISWTTPTTMNPATLPHFYFNIKSRDNACPANAHADYGIVVENIQCNTDSVWAGDANGDYTVNFYDPLAVAVAYGQTGSTRPGATTLWQAEYCASWTNSFSNTVNMKHADCNGDGVVDNTDLGAVIANYGLMHLKGGGTKLKTTGNPDLYFDLTGVSFAPGANVSIPIKLGSSAIMMNDFYGLATTINITGLNLTTPPVITYPSSWVGNTTNTLNFTKAGTSSIDWAYARTDHQGISGQGAIAMLNFTVPVNAPNNQQVGFQFSSTEIINNSGEPYTAFNEVDDTATIITSIGTINSNIQYAYVIPNPSSAAATLSVKSAEAGSLTIRITDIAGKTVWNRTEAVGKGEAGISLPATIAAGMYMIHLSQEKTDIPMIIKWIKQ